MRRYFTQPIESPVYDTILTYKEFAHKHGKVEAAPRSLSEYLTYKFWCYAHNYTPISGGCRAEDKAFKTCREWSNQQEREGIEIMLDTT